MCARVHARVCVYVAVVVTAVDLLKWFHIINCDALPTYAVLTKVVMFLFHPTKIPCEDNKVVLHCYIFC